MVAACAWLVVSYCYVLVESLNELVVMARVASISTRTIETG